MSKVRKQFSLTVAVFILVLGAVVFRQQFPDIEHLVEFISSLRERWFIVPAYFLLVGATCFFAPAVTVIGVSGLLWGVWPGALWAWIGCNLWTTLQFLLGRFLGGGVIDRWLKGQPKLLAIRTELQSGGALATVIIRQFPLPFIGVNLSAGMSPISLSHWMLGNAVGLIPNCLIYSALADALISTAAGVRQQAVLKALGAGAVVIAISLSARIWSSKVKSSP
jgi:uncharacterized membrane protein YdjX (TVP38/TMEM64 family)